MADNAFQTYTHSGNSCPTRFVAVRKSRKIRKIEKSLKHFPRLQPTPNRCYTHPGYTWYIVRSVRTWNKGPYTCYWRKDGRLIRLQLRWVYTRRALKGGSINYDNHGSVNPPIPLQGRCQLLSSDIAEELQEILIESPSLLLDDIGEWLAIYHESTTNPYQRQLCTIT